MKPLVVELPFSRMPFYHDILDFDLQEPFKGLFKGEKVRWGILVAAVEGSWTEHAFIPGEDLGSAMLASRPVRDSESNCFLKTNSGSNCPP